jgi:TetR/AcrR family transcriptional repressor of nem operon
MGRPRQFDHERALDQAMRLFWQRGYGATSVQDLVEATGVNRASMYNTFGNKQRLFLAAVDRYVSQVSAARLERLRAPGSARVALEDYFEAMLTFAQDDGPRLGCLLTNSAVEVAPHDARIAASLRASLGAVEDALFEVIQRGQAQGEFPADKDARALARFLLGVIQGLRVLMRARSDEAHLRAVVTTALSTLD